MRTSPLKGLFVLSLVFAVSACGGGGGGGDNGGGGGNNPPPATDTTPDAFSFTPAEGLFPITTVTSETVTITGINAAAAVSVTGGEYAIGDGAFTTAAGNISNNQSLRLRGVAGAEAGGNTGVVVTVGGVTGTFNIVTAAAGTPADTTPDTFSLPDTLAVNPGNTVISDPITVSGVNATAPIAVTGGQYRINGGEWTDEPGTVNPADTVEVRATAPASSNSVTEAVLNIGASSEVFSVITAPAAGEADTVAEPIDVASVDSSVADPSAVEPGQAVIFGPIAVQGIDGDASIDIDGGAYSLDGGGTWSDGIPSAKVSASRFTKMTGTVTNGSSVLVRLYASDFPATRREARLSIGGVSTVFAVTTASQPYGTDTSPEPVAAPEPVSAATGEAVIFNAVTVTGTDAPAPVSLMADEGVTAEYRINGGAWLAAGTEVAVVVGQTLEVRITASADAGSSASATLSIGGQSVSYTVNLPVAENRAPIADAGSAQSVTAGEAVTLDGSGSSDPDGDTLSYSWRQTDASGHQIALTNADTATPSFTAPDVNGDASLSFELTVSDGMESAIDSVNVSVVPQGAENRAPIANAGDVQSVNEGGNVIVTLDGSSSSDADGDTLTYLWEQTDNSGYQIALISADTASVSFSAPDVTQDTVLSFRLTVSDGTLSSSDETSVTIRFTNQAPVADAGADQIVAEGGVVTLTGNATDPDGGTPAFAWSPVSGPAVRLNNANSATASFTAPAVTANTALVFRLTATDSHALSDTDTITVTVQDTNRAPTVDAGVNQNVTAGDPVTLNGTASDADGDNLTYAWSQTDNSGVTLTLANANTASPSFTAPAVNGVTTLTFTLTVSDGAKSASDSVDITVSPPGAGNLPPLANADADQDVNEGANVTLNGSGSSDPESGTLTYAWTQLSGPAITLSGANTASASFTAPDVTADTVLSFRLTVTDNGGLTNTDDVNITVRFVNQAPDVNAGVDRFMDEGASLTLTGSASDPDGDSLTYSWTVPAGFTATGQNTNTLNITGTPDVTEDTNYTFTLTATDSRGASASDAATVTVRFVNQTPQADAGSSQNVTEGTVVTLQGSSTDADGDTLTYQWSQTVGPAVTLSNANTPTASFTAPDITEDTDYTFTLIVRDSHGASALDTVTVTARFVNQAPGVNAGLDKTMDEGASLTLTGSGSDPDGDSLTYSWTVPAGFTATGQNTNTLNITGTPDVTEDTDYTFTLTVTDNHGASASDTATVTVRFVNQTPSANAGAGKSMDEDASLTLTGSGSDPDGDNLTYSWTVPAGFTANGQSTNTLNITGTPNVTEDTNYTFTLTVTDGHGASASDSVVVQVRFVNNAPSADAGTDKLMNEGEALVLTGNAVDADNGDSVTYSWTVPAGFTTTGENTNTLNITGTPDVTENTNYTFTLTVTDSHGASASDSATVTVRFVNQAPQADAGLPQNVTEGTAVTLQGSGTDADGDTLAYQWTQTGGPGVTLSNANTATANFTAPDVSTATTLSFQLRVSDGNANAVSDVTVTVTDIAATNQPPVANAGTDQSVNEGATVTLDGSGSSDADGDPLTYQWEEISGPGISLTGANTANPTFTAPEILDGTVDYVLRLTVSDGTDTSTDTVTITVNNVNQAPVVDAGADQSISEGGTTTLNGSGSDPDADSMSFSWSVPAGFTASGQDTATLNITGTPDVTQDTDYTFTLTVTDSQGASASDTAIVTVVFANQTPVANAGADITILTDENVTLLGENSHDPDTGDSLTYSWDVPAGFSVVSPVAANLEITGTPPDLEADLTYTFTLTVTDSHGVSATDTVNVTVLLRHIYKEVLAPINAHEGMPVTLTAEAFDLTGPIDSYEWRQVRGKKVAMSYDTSPMQFTAPDAEPTETLSFELIVKDDIRTETQLFTVQVSENPSAPNLVIQFPTRYSLTTDTNQADVLIRGTASDPDGMWMGGAAITVAGADATDLSGAWGKWETRVPIYGGLNELVVQAKDSLGYIKLQTISVTKRYASFQAPKSAVVDSDSGHLLVAVDGHVVRGDPARGMWWGYLGTGNVDKVVIDHTPEKRYIYNEGAILHSAVPIAGNENGRVASVLTLSDATKSGPSLVPPILDLEMDEARNRVLVLQKNAAGTGTEIISVDLDSGNRALVASKLHGSNARRARNLMVYGDAAYVSWDNVEAWSITIDALDLTADVPSLTEVMSSCESGYLNTSNTGYADISNDGSTIYFKNRRSENGVYHTEIFSVSTATFECAFVAEFGAPDGTSVASVSEFAYDRYGGNALYLLNPVLGAVFKFDLVTHQIEEVLNWRMFGKGPQTTSKFYQLSYDPVGDTVFAMGLNEIYGLDVYSGERWVITSSSVGSGPWLMPQGLDFDLNGGAPRLIVAANDAQGNQGVFYVDPYGDGTRVTDELSAQVAIAYPPPRMSTLVGDFSNHRLLFGGHDWVYGVVEHPFDGSERATLSSNSIGTGDLDITYRAMVLSKYAANTLIAWDDDHNRLYRVALSSGNRSRLTTFTDPAYGLGFALTASQIANKKILYNGFPVTSHTYVGDVVNDAIYAIPENTGVATTLSGPSPAGLMVGSGPALDNPHGMVYDSENDRLFVNGHRTVYDGDAAIWIIDIATGDRMIFHHAPSSRSP